MPAPSLVRPPAPLKADPKTTVLPLVSIEAACPAAMGAMAAETSCMLPAAYCSVPPLKVMLPAATGTADAEKFSTPPLSVVPPV